MSVDLEADKLTVTLTDHVAKLNAKIAAASELIDKTFTEGGGTVDDITTHVRKVGDSLAKLRAALGQQTNSPPA